MSEADLKKLGIDLEKEKQEHEATLKRRETKRKELLRKQRADMQAQIIDQLRNNPGLKPEEK
jgi:hypothetical protein